MNTKVVVQAIVAMADEAATKVIFLAIESASKKWTMPIQNWKLAMNRFITEFKEQLTPYL